MKSLQVSDELHLALKQRARKEGRMLIALIAQAFSLVLGSDFPACREAEMLPKGGKGKK